MPYRPKDATPVTARVNREGESFYPLDDRDDFDKARRGLVAPIPNGQVRMTPGR